MDGFEVLLEPGWEFGVSRELLDGWFLLPPTANKLPLDWDLLLLQNPINFKWLYNSDKVLTYKILVEILYKSSILPYLRPLTSFIGKFGVNNDWL